MNPCGLRYSTELVRYPQVGCGQRSAPKVSPLLAPGMSSDGAETAADAAGRKVPQRCPPLRPPVNSTRSLASRHRATDTAREEVVGWEGGAWDQGAKLSEYLKTLGSLRAINVAVSPATEPRNRTQSHETPPPPAMSNDQDLPAAARSVAETTDPSAGCAMVPTVRLHITIRIEDPCALPPFPGSELRGMFGQGLKSLYCHAGSPRSCTGCPEEHRAECLYARLFAPPHDETDPPRPFALRLTCPEEDRESPLVRLRPGTTLSLGLTLMGPAIDQQQSYLAALAFSGRQRLLGRGSRSRFKIVDVTEEHDSKAASDPGTYLHERAALLAQEPVLLVRLSTPLCLRESQRTLSWIDPERLLRHAFVRARQLAQRYARSQTPILQQPTTTLRELEVRALSCETLSYLRGGRGGHRQPMEGVLGEIVLSCYDPATLLLLVAAERLQVGRHTTFGFGAIDLLPVE